MNKSKLILFDARSYDRTAFAEAKAQRPVDIAYQAAPLNSDTVALAEEFEAVCVFVNDRVDAAVLERLHKLGVRLVALRCAGTNNVDLRAAKRLGMPVVRVPSYSPHAVAEHAVALLLSLNRKIHRAYARAREFNFSLDGLVGFDLHGKTIGIIGTGQIGRVAAKIFAGFGCRLRLHDPSPDADFAAAVNGRYVPLAQLFADADVISLHLPLLPKTHHLIDAAALAQMQPHVILLNTGRGGLIDSRALVRALKDHKIGGAGLDVYEEEEGIFFGDRSGDVMQDDLLARLLTFPNVLVTAHQGFLTAEALRNIAATTLANVVAMADGKTLKHRVAAQQD